MKFDVHLYPVVRVKFTDVEADSMEEAIRKVESERFYGSGVSFQCHGARDCEFADEIPYALVDVQGDEEFDQSKWFLPSKDGWKEGWKHE